MSAYGPLADFYDALTQDVDYPGLRAYLNAHFRREGVIPRRILDMACGTGSLSLLFAREGLEVVGMDLSGEMIAAARAKAADHPNPPRFLRGDMGDFRLTQPVDAAVCMLDSFNYLLDPAEGVSALRCFYEALAPGGIFIFDVRPRRALMAFDGQVFVDETEDVLCMWRTEFDDEENLCRYGMDIFIREGNVWRREQEEHVEYAYRLRWLKKQMESMGFRSVSFWGDRTMSPPTAQDSRVFITARRD